ncbi:MAG: OmpA family protein [Planctomycetaceae bacterium]|jgi:flagellar motor protein MotB|nr:OmpA family protein [Planctomycetaceae bacterium]
MNPDDNIPESQDWLITYGDLMTLLLCCFVMLYAISTVQEEQFQSATESLRGGFGFFGNTQKSFKTVAQPLGQKIGGTIPFDWGSDDLSESAKQELNEVYRQLLGTASKIQIAGKAEWGEPSAYRREWDLAYSRAINVWDYLISLGMSRERFEIVQQTGEAEGSLVEIRTVR